jgi:hypothetical protein
VTGRWTGGASVRLRSWGMYNVSRPLAALDVSPQRAALMVRPAIFARRLPGYPWVVTPADPHVVFPVRATGFTRGVGFAVGDAKPYYFWCGRARESVLDALAAAGFVVDRTERRPQYR